MKYEPFVSVVIPVKAINEYIHEGLAYIRELDYSNFEVLIFPDKDDVVILPGARIIPTGNVGPAEKRDLAIKYACGEILAFLDDDAFPRRDWLNKAVRHFKEPAVAAVGGPAITPENDTTLQKASGAVFASRLGGGNLTYRYVPEKLKEVDDYPSVNLFVRKNIFEFLGGFDTEFWPGEDTKLCLDITKKLGMKIIYDPEVVVWHHRRELFLPHMRQVLNYAVHRGYFVKHFPETSLRLNYFIPSIFVSGLVLGPIIGFWLPIARYLYGGVLVFYGCAVMLEGLRTKELKLGVLTTVGIFVTHVVYGVGFMVGIFSRSLKR